jgi:protein-disulfide isomerase
MSRLKPPVSAADHFEGPRGAPVTLVEFGDFECSYCGEAYPRLKAVHAALGERLCFVFRNFPLSNAHPHALLAAGFAEAAATIGRFWEMHDLLFEHQDALEAKDLISYARSLGFSQALIEAALRGDYLHKVRQDFSSGIRSGVNGTPCVFINGARWEGPTTEAALVPVLERLASG